MPSVCTVALSLAAGVDTFPARSVLVALTASIPPSTGLAKLKSTYPLATSVADNVAVAVVAPSVMLITSPTAAPETNVTFTVTSVPFSVALMTPSSFPSVTMATLMTGAVLSTAMVVGTLVLPDGSVATTVMTVPSAGGVVGVTV